MTDTVDDFGLRIPPALNPEVTDWIKEISEGYRGLTREIEWFRERVTNLVDTGKLDPAEKINLLGHFAELKDALDAAVVVTAGWTPTDNDPDELTPKVHRIADHVKHVYAVGARDISALQYRLQKLAYAEKIDIEAHNNLQHDVCYGMGDRLYSVTTSNLHDEDIPDSAQDWGDNTYADGRTLMTKAHLTGWEALCDTMAHNTAIKMYGDGVISEFPECTVCLITPVEDLNTQRWGYWHPTIEIDLADLCRRSPWINFQDTDAKEQK